MWTFTEQLDKNFDMLDSLFWLLSKCVDLDMNVKCDVENSELGKLWTTYFPFKFIVLISYRMSGQWTQKEI